jgi:hypothetical protein
MICLTKRLGNFKREIATRFILIYKHQSHGSHWTSCDHEFLLKDHFDTLVKLYLVIIVVFSYFIVSTLSELLTIYTIGLCAAQIQP